MAPIEVPSTQRQANSADCDINANIHSFSARALDLTNFRHKQLSDGNTGGYGVYWEDDEEDILVLCPRGVLTSSSSKAFSSSSALTSPRSIATGISSLSPSPCNEWVNPREDIEIEIENEKNDNKTIFFVFDNNRAPIACRSFESLMTSRITQVELTIHGYRIIQDITGEVAEFKVRMSFNG